MKTRLIRTSAIVLTIVMLLTAIPFISGGFAGFDGRVTAVSLNVRTGPGTNHTRVATLPRNSVVRVVGQSGEWFRINHAGTVRYVHSRYIQRTGATAPPASSEPFIGRTTPASLNVRTGPGTNHTRVSTLARNTTVQVVGRVGDWLRISHGGATRYVHSRYVQRIGNVYTPAPYPPAPFEQFSGRVTATSLNVRTGPNTSFARVGTLARNSNVYVIGQSGLWWRIIHAGVTRYVHSNYIQRIAVTPPPVELPPVEPPPPPPAFEQFSGRVTATSLNVRTGPNTSFARVGTLPRNSTVTVVGQSGVWFQIIFNGDVRYVHSNYIQRTDGTTPGLDPAPQIPPPPPPFEHFSARVTSVTLNVRSGPGTNHTNVGTLPRGANIRIIGITGVWFHTIFNGQQRYIHSNYVIRVSTTPPAPDFNVFTARVVVNLATMRNGPGTNFGNAGNLPTNSHIQITGQNGDWFRFAINSMDRYIHATNVVNADLHPLYTPFQAFNGTSNDYATVFGGPSIVYVAVGTVTPGQNVRIINRHYDWWQVNVAGVIGYIYVGYIAHTFAEPAQPNIVARTRYIPNTASRLERNPERIVFHHNAGHRASCALFNPVAIANSTVSNSYHFMIAPCGTIFEGRPLIIIDGQAHGFRAAHTSAFNDDIGIAFLGHYDRSVLACSHGCQHSAPDQLTPAQMQATLQLTQWLINELYIGINQNGIIGPVTMHHQYSNTLCPGAGPEEWINSYLMPQTNSWLRFFR
ncbi:MAG: SH3 domain-containing protein [Oscillospiraceae bacterium]|nr:SH3 domain-containing protein [Oscillospiraceae bacterium]